MAASKVLGKFVLREKAIFNETAATSDQKLVRAVEKACGRVHAGSIEVGSRGVSEIGEQ